MEVENRCYNKGARNGDLGSLISYMHVLQVEKRATR
jgi:hypothetical protein